MMQDLTDREFETLQMLARKDKGELIGFVNIAAARMLSDLGLALRSHEGWDITPDGNAELARRGGAPT